MSLIKWRPRDVWTPLTDLQDEVNRLFDLSTGRWPGEGTALWSPSLDVFEDKDTLVVKADLPGVKEQDIDVSVQGDTLVLKGERKQESEVREKGYYRSERVYGAFQRSLTLPCAVDQGKVKATYKSGVLEVRLPKAEEAKEKKIHIDVEK